MTVAYVLSGGSSLGAIQVGMAQALEEAGVQPDLIFGTSVGAVNGSWLAGGGSADGLEKIWLGLERKDMFPFETLHGLRALFGKMRHFFPADGLRAVLQENVRFLRMEDAPIPFSVLAADAKTGAEVILSTGLAVDAILASAALPGIFPAVTINDRMLIDGGIANNTPITAAVEAGADEVWVLSTGYSCALIEPPSHPLLMALHSIGLLVQQRLVRETRDRNYPVPVRLIPPPCPITVGPLDFSQTEDLIMRARTGTRQWLEQGMPHAQPLAVSHH